MPRLRSRRPLTLTLTLTFSLLLAGCAPEEESPVGEDGVLTIAFIGKSTANPVFRSAQVGAEDAARDLAQRHNVPIEIQALTPPQESGAAQAEQIAAAVEAGADAILISASEASVLQPAIDQAVARGVEVMTFDSDVPESQRFAYYGVDDTALGAEVVRRLASALNEQGEIAVLAGNPEAPNLRERVEGVRQEAANHPGIEIVGVYHHDETPEAAAEEVMRVSRENPQIDGWAMVGGWALFSPQLLNELNPARTKIVSVDALPEQLPYVESGLAPVLLAQPTYMWGYVGVQTIADKLLTEKEIDEHIAMHPVPVMRENLGYWARQLRDWGFDGVTEEYVGM